MHFVHARSPRAPSRFLSPLIFTLVPPALVRPPFPASGRRRARFRAQAAVRVAAARVQRAAASTAGVRNADPDEELIKELNDVRRKYFIEGTGWTPISVIMAHQLAGRPIFGEPGFVDTPDRYTQYHRPGIGWAPARVIVADGVFGLPASGESGDAADLFAKYHRPGVGWLPVMSILARKLRGTPPTPVEAIAAGYAPAAKQGVAVERQTLHAQLLELLRPRPFDSYALIVGVPGTGKSTAICKAAREASAVDVNGVVYIRAEEAAAFSAKLSKPSDVPADNSLRSSWLPLAKKLKVAAADFNKLHRRPMTLVIDDAHVIHQADPALLDTLQDLAKTSADRGDLRVVFVTSNGSVLQHMKSRCAWSSCSTFEVGDADISEEEAIKHLMAKRGWPDSDLAATEAAKYIVNNITGTRFGLLNAVLPGCSTVAAAKAWQRVLHDWTLEKLAAQGLGAGHRLFGCLCDAPEQKLLPHQLVVNSGITAEQRDALIKAGVLALHADGTITCASRHVLTSFEGLRAAPAGASAPLAAAASGAAAYA